MSQEQTRVKGFRIAWLQTGSDKLKFSIGGIRPTWTDPSKAKVWARQSNLTRHLKRHADVYASYASYGTITIEEVVVTIEVESREHLVDVMSGIRAREAAKQKQNEDFATNIRIEQLKAELAKEMAKIGGKA